ncbi:MAG: phenylalanine--tRNA ligase subunit alpha [archaeon]
MPDPEHAVLSALREGGEFSLHALVEPTGLSADAIRRILSGLEEQGLVSVKREKISAWMLSKTGNEVLSKGSLPEQRLCAALASKSLGMNALQSSFDGSPQEFAAAFGLAKRSSWIEVKNENGETVVHLTGLGTKSFAHSPLWIMLQAIARDEVPPSPSPIISELSARGLIVQKQSTTELVRITEKGLVWLKSEKPEKKAGKVLGPLSPKILASGEWRDASFKPYDVSAGVEPKYGGRIHPLRQVIRDVSRIMVELGFQEDESPLVESAFWNMDVMFIPQDHPAREIQDTFYVSGRAVVSDSDLVKRVKATHEHGGKTGSKGFGYEWDPKIAMQLLLRTHGSATTFRTLARKPPVPFKSFSIGRVFRNEAIDATHLAEFYQVDGLVMGEGLTLRHLMGTIKEFYARLGLTEIRFKPTYNPYTEPSMEALAYHPILERWVEIINSGMFRPETLKPLGIDVPVISWGFGLERLALFLYAKNTLKEILGPDVPLDFIRNYSGVSHGIPSPSKGGGAHGQR